MISWPRAFCVLALGFFTMAAACDPAGGPDPEDPGADAIVDGGTTLFKKADPPCGKVDQECCSDSVCTNDLACNTSNVCEAVSPCRKAGGCRSSAAPCGAHNQPCCRTGTACKAGLSCFVGICLSRL